jgi:DHA1 family tetracycline resistance protein-like MFS transporter
VTRLLSRWRQQSLAWLVFFVIVVDLIGFGIVIPILPFLSPHLGGGTDDVAFILVSYSVMAALVAPLWGRLSDRLGRRLILFICLLGGAVSHFLLAASNELWMVYLSRAVAGAMAGSLPVATALIADASTPDQRSRAMGLIGRAFGIGLVLGPVIGGVLARSETDFTLPCVVAGVLSASAAVLALLLLPKPTPKAADRANADADGASAPVPPIRMMMGQRGVLLFVSQFTLHTCAVSASIYLFPLWMSQGLGWTAHEVGLFFGLVGVVMIMTQGNFLGRMTDRFGTIWVLRAATLTFSASLLVSTVATGALAMGALGLLAFSSATLCLPVLNTIASHAVPASWRGQFFGVTASSASMGRVGGPLIAATLLARGDFALAWLGTSAVVMLVVGWSILQGADPLAGIKIDKQADVAPIRGNS